MQRLTVLFAKDEIVVVVVGAPFGSVSLLSVSVRAQFAQGAFVKVDDSGSVVLGC